MTNHRAFTVLACLIGAALATGCTNPPRYGGAPPGHARGDSVNRSGAAAALAAAAPGLKEGIALYDNGDFNSAIKRLGAADVMAGPKAIQLAALKYSAFSYCLTSRQSLCRQQFDKAFKLDAAFDLDPGEHGHPLWQPVFVKAKKNR